MRRDQHLARLPEISACIKAWQQKAREAERAGDMTEWHDAQRNIRERVAERTKIRTEHH